MSYYQEFPDFSESIERIFNQDIALKKKSGKGVFSRAPRLRKKEAVQTPSEHLKGFARKQVYAPGVCQVYRMEEIEMMDLMARIKNGEIPNLKEITDLEFTQAQTCLAELRRLHTNTELQYSWKMRDNTKFQTFFETYQVAKATRGQVFIGQAALDFMKKIKPSNAQKGVRHSPQEQTEGVVREQRTLQIPDEPLNQVTVLTAENELAKIEREEFVEKNVILVRQKFTYNVLIQYLDRLGLYLNPDSEFNLELNIKENI